MISLDFGILFTVKVSIEGVLNSSAGFRILPSNTSKALLEKLQSVYRFIDGTGHIFASDLIGLFEEQVITGHNVARLSQINETFVISLLIYLTDTSLAQKLDLSYRRSDLSELQNLPTSVKYCYYIDNNQLPIENPIDKSAIVGLAPPVLIFPKGKIASAVFTRDGSVLTPSDEDDVNVQYNFRQAIPGLYEINLNEPTGEKRKVYIDPILFNKVPFAIMDVVIPKGNFTLNEYELIFKKK